MRESNTKHPPEAQTMTSGYTNRLIHEKSPYLLQHAHNPVDWFAYGEEAFEKARQEDKPVFLSIGYATCHWCHVMERESFENENTARFMNEHFISIKVDREERPDVDRIYMRALTAMGYGGGWPLSMFLTPDRKPIVGGTYFPPEPRGNIPSFPNVLTQVLDFWKNRRNEVLDSAGAILDHLQKTAANSPERLEMPDREKTVERLIHMVRTSYDAMHGGFLNNGPNKFPPSMLLSALIFLLPSLHESLREEMRIIVEHTLDRMIAGGIYDRVGGGIARYSTDHQWLIPHFEKMLYDNALFAKALTEAFLITKNPQYRDTAIEIFEYIQRDMTSSEGAFHSAEDADSEGEEGRFYVWTHEEFHSTLNDTLSQKDRELLGAFWGVRKQGNFDGNNILHEERNLRYFCDKEKIDENHFSDILRKGKERLFRERSKRVRPLCDDKILVSWNGLMIGALSLASRAFRMPELHKRAEKSANFILNHMRKEDGRLHRRYRQGEAKHPANLDDYTHFGTALLELYRSDFNTRWLKEATGIGQIIIEDFSADGEDSNGFYDTPRSSGDLLFRSMDGYDGVEPSGAAMATHLFGRLSLLGISGNEFETAANGIFRRFRYDLEERPIVSPVMVHAFLMLEGSPHEIAVVSENHPHDDETIEKIRELLEERIPGRYELAMGSMNTIKEESEIIPLLENRIAVNGKTTIYLCRKMTCNRPVNTVDELRLLLDEQGEVEQIL